MVPLILMVAVLSFFGFSQVSADYFDIVKNIEIYSAITKELELNYVDEIDHKKVMNKGAKTILRSLDPYSDFIPEEDLEDYRSTTTGEYGGIGSIIGQKAGDCIVLMPYEGFPAHKSGLEIGDKIIEIDGIRLKGLSTSEISKKLKGKAGTSVELLIEKAEEQKLITLVREKITISNVPYAGVVRDSVGYIKLTDFTTNAKNEVEKALLTLKREEGIKGLILDLRSNPGGLLDEAIKITNIFLRHGSDVVVTKGRDNSTLKEYKAPSQALDVNIPVVVLINGMSASASEIVSGVLQDHDRGVLVGRKTFGKGLVQSTRPLPYNAQLKLTTAKYYIPSGRCIQAIDYSHRNEDGSVDKIPDSLKLAYKTKVGRVVYDGAGIDPDVEVESRKYDEMLVHLVNSDIVFDFASLYKKKYPTAPDARTFKVSDALFAEFITYLKKENFQYESSVETYLDELVRRMGADSTTYDVTNEIERIRLLVETKKKNAIMEHQEDMKILLKEEIISRYYLQKGIIESSFDYDPDIKEAMKVITDSNRYTSILKP